MTQEWLAELHVLAKVLFAWLFLTLTFHWQPEVHTHLVLHPEATVGTGRTWVNLWFLMCDNSHYWLFHRKFAGSLKLSLIVVLPQQVFVSVLVVESVLVKQLWPWDRPAFYRHWSTGDDRLKSSLLVYAAFQDTGASQSFYFLNVTWTRARHSDTCLLCKAFDFFQHWVARTREVLWKFEKRHSRNTADLCFLNDVL